MGEGVAMAPCDRVRELLSASLDGELPADAVGRVDEHLAGCARCREERQRLAQVRSLVRTLPTRHIPQPLRDELRATAAARDAGGRPRRVLVAASLMLAMAAGGALGVVTGDERAAPVPVDTLVIEHLLVSGPAPGPADPQR